MSATVRSCALVLSATAGLVLAGCASAASSSSTATSTGHAPTSVPATAKGADSSLSCGLNSAGQVACTLPSDGNLVNLSTVLSEAQALDSSITSSTVMVVTAEGGSGGTDQKIKNGGQGGVAQTATSIADYETAAGSSSLYYYLGANGVGDNGAGARGGASTIVSMVDLNTTAPCISGYSSCTATNVVVVAGGGGGGGIDGVCEGGIGAKGGSVTASTATPATASGNDGGLSACGGGGGGHAGGNGNGGGGGQAGAGVSAHDGGSGADGIGGLGGAVHDGSGASSPTYWINGTAYGASGTMSAVASDGAGGEGEWRSGSAINDGGGGGGGGGFGGGGGGGSGGSTEAGGGGAGGGSFAAGVTVLSPSIPSVTAGSTSDVVLTFYP